MIDIKNVSVQFETDNGPVDAVDQVSLNIKEGEIFGVIGYSGAGKSTLVRTINMLQRPTAGDVFVNGLNMTELKEKDLLQACKKIGMIFQHFNLMKQRTVADNVAFPLKNSGLSKQEQQEKVDRLLQLVDLYDLKGAYPAQLSGGQKQRVGIARALANDPKVLLCDEATSALDPNTTDQILNLLKELNQELGLTIVIITHEMAVIKEICDRVAIMSQGQVVEYGSVFDIFTQAQHPITQRFIESASPIEKDIQMILDQVQRDEKWSAERIIRINYGGEQQGSDIISSIAKSTQVNPRILFANVENISGQMVGNLLVELEGELDQVQAAKALLGQSNVRLTDYSYLSNENE